MRFLHTMLRVADLDLALTFWCEHLGLEEIRRKEYEKGRFTLVFLRTKTPNDTAQIELTHNWDQTDSYSTGRFFGHIAFCVPNIYETCDRLLAAGIVLNRPPRDGRMAFVKSPDGVSVELLQEGEALPLQEPWIHLPNQGSW